jgi:hypothetical protein
MSDELTRRALAYVAISNFDEATGTRRSPEQFADTEDAIAKILGEIKPFHTPDCSRDLSCKCAWRATS